MTTREWLAEFVDALAGRWPRPPRPTYDQIASVIEAVLDSGLYELELRQDGKSVEEPVWQLGKALEKAGLIDAGGVG